jgi:hypothetical protein
MDCAIARLMSTIWEEHCCCFFLIHDDRMVTSFGCCAHLIPHLHDHRYMIGPRDMIDRSGCSLSIHH